MGHFFFFQEIVPSTKMKHAGTIFSLVKSLFSIFWQMNAVLSVHSKANLWLAKVPYLILLQVNTSQIQSYPKICVNPEKTQNWEKQVPQGRAGSFHSVEIQRFFCHSDFT